MLIAIPSDTTNGLEATISEHFGHCAAFTLVEIDDGRVGDVSTVSNVAHEQGGCMAPVTLLKEHGVDAMVAGGMGQRPLAGFQQVGIDVFFKEDASTVQQAVELFVAGKCRSFGAAQTCEGGGGHCGHEHHHHGPETEPIEGRAEVLEGRFVTVEYELKDAEGVVLDSSERTGPMRFVHGSSQIMPAIELAIAGKERGDRLTVEVSAADSFGERDEGRVIEVSKEQIPENAAVGMVLTAEDDQGRQFPLRVVDIGPEKVTLDGNHPLAGTDVVFDLTIKDVETVKA
jgi:FKBP-type peptidyl-prolyl cis-trans isomerase 2/predicted Fe-Mo cluster-binding NifX family protein